MQENAGLRESTASTEGERRSPPHLCPLTATYENAPPQPANASAEDAQLGRVTWNGVVLVVAQHNLSKPLTDFGSTVMLPALKFSLDGFQLRDHPLLSRDPPDDESFVADALPTEVSEAQKCEGLRFSLATLLPVSSGEPPEPDQSCLVRV